MRENNIEQQEPITDKNAEEEEFEALTDIPLDKKRLVAESVDYSIRNLYDLEQDGDLILQPDFQRLYVWNRTKSSRLIESVLLNVPIPVVYLAEEKDGTLSVIDGQQRLSSFISYLKGEYKLNKLTILSDLNGKVFSQLEPEARRRIKNTPIRCIIIKRESHEDIKFEIFERLNTGSVKLNEQELRNCVYRGSLNNLLKELSEDKEWVNFVQLSKHDKDRMVDREMILRFIAFYSSYHRYGSSLKRFLNKFMEENRNANEDKLNEYRKVFKKSLLLSKTVFGDKAFKRFIIGNSSDYNGKWEEKVNKALFDAVMVGFVPYEQHQIVPLADRIRDELVNLMTNNDEFINAITQSTGDKRRVRARIDIWSNKLRSIVDGNDNQQRLFSRSFREQLFNQNPMCSICNQKIMIFEDATVDHTVPFSKGGETTPSNARLAHRYCNSKRGNKN
ncbi:MAG: DUF262 domain-containing protein [Desulfotomaculum sp.]|nr:DUF262 domain-containing protein [Desulfotomaculum sp.]